MFSLVYISRAVTRPSGEEVLHLLQHCRVKNQRLGVTGMLLLKDGNFMQLLEGEEKVVRDLYTVISGDLRHCNVTVIAEEELPARQFADWSMGFRNLDSLDIRDLPGYTPFLKTPFTAQEFSSDPSRGQQLLQLFRKIG